MNEYIDKLLTSLIKQVKTQEPPTIIFKNNPDTIWADKIRKVAKERK